MEAPVKFLCILWMLVVVFVSINGGFERVEGAGECGRSTTPDNEALKLAPCATAAQDASASVPQSCCVQIKKFGQNPNCLCAVLLSKTAKSAGVKPEIAIAITIPKRCNLANRPVGYKCGPYTLP